MIYLCPDPSTPPWLVLLLSFEKAPEVPLWVPAKEDVQKKKMKECTVKLKFVLSFYLFMLFIIFQAYWMFQILVVNWLSVF